MELPPAVEYRVNIDPCAIDLVDDAKRGDDELPEIEDSDSLEFKRDTSTKGKAGERCAGALELREERIRSSHRMLSADVAVDCHQISLSFREEVDL